MRPGRARVSRDGWLTSVLAAQERSPDALAGARDRSGAGGPGVRFRSVPLLSFVAAVHHQQQAARRRAADPGHLCSCGVTSRFRAGTALVHEEILCSRVPASSPWVSPTTTPSRARRPNRTSGRSRQVVPVPRTACWTSCGATSGSVTLPPTPASSCGAPERWLSTSSEPSLRWPRPLSRSPGLLSKWWLAYSTRRRARCLRRAFGLTSAQRRCAGRPGLRPTGVVHPTSPRPGSLSRRSISPSSRRRAAESRRLVRAVPCPRRRSAAAWSTATASTPCTPCGAACTTLSDVERCRPVVAPRHTRAATEHPAVLLNGSLPGTTWTSRTPARRTEGLRRRAA